MENVKFVLFIPINIYYSKNMKSFSYITRDDYDYPCLLGLIIKDERPTNDICSKKTVIEVISGKKYDIVELEEYRKSNTIYDDKKTFESPALIVRNIKCTIENLLFIKKYIDLKGHISIKEINKHHDFAKRLNHLMTCTYIINDSDDFYYEYNQFKENKIFRYGRFLSILESPKKYLKEIEEFNKTSLYNIEYYKTDKWKTDSEEEMKRVYSRLEHILRK